MRITFPNSFFFSNRVVYIFIGTSNSWTFLIMLDASIQRSYSTDIPTQITTSGVTGGEGFSQNCITTQVSTSSAEEQHPWEKLVWMIWQLRERSSYHTVWTRLYLLEVWLLLLAEALVNWSWPIQCGNETDSYFASLNYNR